METESGNESIMEVLDPETLDMPLAGLQINTLYTVTICASTSVGCGPATVVTNRTDEDGEYTITP